MSVTTPAPTAAPYTGTESANSAPPRSLRIEALLLPAAFYLILVGCVLMAALSATHGHFVYALDDPYIHMAIAKNLAAHGVFGVTSHEFTAASSSILWPLLLAALYKIFGPAVIIPLISQIVFGMALIWLSLEVLKRAGVTSTRYACAVLGFLVVALPMVPMTFIAMEHLLHAIATLLLATVSADYLYGSRARFLPVLVCAAAVTSVRYEGLFLVAAVGLLLLLQKQIIQAIAIGAAGAVPVALFGLYSIAHGGFFLPNSLLLKAHPVGLETLLRLRDVATACPEVYVLAIAALLLLVFGTHASRKSRGLLQIFLITALLHQAFGTYGWFFRYETYLVALGLIAVAVAAWESFPTFPCRRAWAATALLVLAAPLMMRGYKSITATPLVMTDIYRQQFQMGQFFRTYYPQGRIAVNDIGAITFYSDPYLTDLFGLGSTEITRARRTMPQGDGFLYLLQDNPAVRDVMEKNNVEVVAIYDHWFGLQQGYTPPGWIRVGVWRVPNRTILGGDAVSFYGVGTENAARLRYNLAEFHNQLPPELAQLAVP